MTEVGICLLMTQHDFDVVGLARKVEELGFGSLWAPEHGVVPADFSVGESGANAGAPSAYSDGRINQIIDPLVYLAAAASATQSVRLGNAIRSVSPRRSRRWTWSQAGGLCSASGPAGCRARRRCWAPTSPTGGGRLAST